MSAAKHIEQLQMSNANSRTVVKRLFALALPTFGQLIAEPTFVLVDTAIVGHLGQSALAGLALGSSIILTAVGLCIFLAYSTTSQVAKLFGAGKTQEGLQAGIDGLWLSLIIGIALAALLYLGAEPLCYALGGRGDDLAQAVAYTRAVVLGAPGMLLVYAANGLYRGLQKVKITLVVAVAGAVLNTVLDIAFVFGLGLGVAGSGYATFAAQWFMGIALLVPAIRWAQRGGVDLKPHAGGIGRAGREGLPLFVRTLALRVGMVATVMGAAALGSEVLASYQVVNATWNFVLNIMDSIAIAGQTLVGAQLGAGAFAEARSLTRATMRTGLFVGVVVGMAFIAIGFVAPQLFSSDTEVQHYATVGMVVTGLALPLQSWMWAADGILIGAGDFSYLAKTCTLVTVVYLGLLAAVVFGLGPADLPYSSAMEKAIATYDPGFNPFPAFPNFGGGYELRNLIRCAALWVVFDFGLMGGRAITNGLRIRSDKWMIAGHEK